MVQDSFVHSPSSGEASTIDVFTLSDGQRTRDLCLCSLTVPVQERGWALGSFSIAEWGCRALQRSPRESKGECEEAQEATVEQSSG